MIAGGIACAVAGLALLLRPPVIPAAVARGGRWTAVAVLLAALCTANAHAPDNGNAWWGILLLVALAALGGWLRPATGARLGLRLTGLSLAVGGGLLLAGGGEAGVIFAVGAAFVAPVGGLCAGFRLQAQHVRGARAGVTPG